MHKDLKLNQWLLHALNKTTTKMLKTLIETHDESIKLDLFLTTLRRFGESHERKQKLYSP